MQKTISYTKTCRLLSAVLQRTQVCYDFEDLLAEITEMRHYSLPKEYETFGQEIGDLLDRRELLQARTKLEELESLVGDDNREVIQLTALLEFLED